MIQRLDPRLPQRLPRIQAHGIPGQPPVQAWSPRAMPLPTRNDHLLQTLRGMGLGDDIDPGQVEAFGLPPQDLINALYDIFGSYPRKNVLPYFYSFTLADNGGQLPALTPLGTARPSIKVSSDAAMIATLITGTSTGEYSCFLRTDSSDRQLMQYPIHSAAMVGTAERPFPFPKPLLIAPNTTVSFDITDLSNAVNEVWFTFVGFKVYRRQYAAAG